MAYAGAVSSAFRTRRRGAAAPLYVEILVRAPLDRVWQLTQDPVAHARWDARFTAIVPTRVRDDGAEEFRYELDLGLHTIRGTGVSKGTRTARGGERTSALVFDSDDPLSPLGAGRGYWRYIPTEDGVRFLTGYDYAPGWGILGRVLDPLLIRPFVWWLTARSFDRLRLWAESGILPEETTWWRSLRRGRRGRPRARNCLARPASRERATVMDDAPATLAEIAR
ncbi:hypothetical protein GCM10009803_26630 [Microbacterium ginsengiterrae]